MTAPSVIISTDFTQAMTLGEALKRLDVELSTNRHMSSVTKAAFSILADNFVEDTARMATLMPELMHHVYEWQHVGQLGFELFKPVMRGSGNSRVVSWDWKASKTTVPTDVDALGRPKFPAWFPVSKLHKIHVFVWKAPIMEYGLETTVKPKLSRLLVMPNPDRRLVLDTHHKAPRSVVFSPYSYTIDHSGQPTTGAFTAWFNSWFTEGPAATILKQQFEPKRDNAFKLAFLERVRGITGNSTTKKFSMTIDSGAAARGKIIAKLITGDLERNYIAMAAARKNIVNQSR